MIRKTMYTLAAILSVLLVCSNAMAAFSFDLTTDYVAGDNQAVFDLTFSTDTDAVVSNYAFEFTFDSSELSYVDYTNTPISGFFPQMFGAFSWDQTAGSLDNFNAAGFAPVTVATGDYLIGSFTFDVTNSIADASEDFSFDTTDVMFGFIIDGQTYKSANGNLDGVLSTQLTDIAPTSSSVPVPGALWLLGSGIAGLAALRRRQAE